MSDFELSLESPLGAAPLAEYVRAAADQGWDLYDADVEDPQFSQSPIADGGKLVLSRAGLREMVIPLALNVAASPVTNGVTNPRGKNVFGYACSPGTGGNASIAAATDPDFGGCGRTTTVTQAATGGTQYWVYSNTSSSDDGLTAPAVPGTTIEIRLRAKIAAAVSGAYKMSLGARFRTGAGNFVSEPVLTQTDATADTYAVGTIIDLVGQVTVPATAAWCGLMLFESAAGVTGAVRVGNAYIGPPTSSYFDGDTIAGDWDGVPHASTSTRFSGKDGLRKMAAKTQRKLSESGLKLRWRDQGASQSTYFDIERGRLEPEMNYRRGVARWEQANLRLWAQPYGNLATDRIVATAAGSGVLITAPLPTMPLGDVAATLKRSAVTLGSVFWTRQTMGLSVLPAGWTPRLPAASMFESGGSMALVGASGAAGSQCLQLVSLASDVQRLGAVKIPNVQAQKGRARVLALMDVRRSQVGLWVGADAGAAGQSPTTILSPSGGVQPGWDLYDLGVLDVGDPDKVPGVQATNGGFGLIAFPIAGASTTAPSWALRLNEVFLLPEDTTVLIDNGDAPAAPYLSTGESVVISDGEDPARVQASSYLDSSQLRGIGAVPKVPVVGASPPSIAALVAKRADPNSSAPENDTLAVTVRVRERFRFAR